MVSKKAFEVAKRRQLFAAEYLVDRNAKEAAIRAGYSPSRAVHTGYELLKNPVVAAQIAKADEARQKELGVTADWIVSRLVAVFEKAFAGAPKVTREGRLIEVAGVPQMEWSPSGSVRPLELLMKHLGIGAERHEVIVSGDARVTYTLKLDRELPKAGEEG